MIPWELLGHAPLPDSAEEISLYRRDDEYSIRIKMIEVMNSRSHGSEEALADLGCSHLSERPKSRVLVGGLGMGFTAAAVLKILGPAGTLVVAELVPGVVAWNRDFIGHLANHPMRDSRTTVREKDVALVLEEERGGFDAILLDVDNGPQSLLITTNQRLYTREGLKTAFAALRQGGVLAIWSAGPPEPEFTHRLTRTGFTVEAMQVRGRGRKGGHHTVWLGFRKN